MVKGATARRPRLALPEAAAVAGAFTSLPASKRRRLLSLMLSMAETQSGEAG